MVVVLLLLTKLAMTFAMGTGRHGGACRVRVSHYSTRHSDAWELKILWLCPDGLGRQLLRSQAEALCL